MDRSTLVAVAGLGGAIGSTLAAGLSMPSGESRNFGLATESPLIESLGRKLLPLESISLDGWDLRRQDLLSICKSHQICPPEALSRVKQQLKAIKLRKGISVQDVAIGDWIRREAAYLLSRKQDEHFDQLILINLCPTEPMATQDLQDGYDWRDLDRLHRTEDLSVSRIYFRLAIEAQAHFINFTPNIAEIPQLRDLAEDAGLVYAGRDGKTGQTFIKSVVAPAFRDRNLHIDGWFSMNLLGNEDGRSLSSPEAAKSKILSKSKCLSSILGYIPGGEDGTGHQVHIHYYPPRGDSKEAWDNIDFRGFMGVPMQMKINWLGQDSILAAPALIDLIRLVVLAAESGLSGPLEAASYFFKDPMVAVGGAVQHSVPEQFAKLLDFVGRRKDG
jgi:myo-inositol-1-phosphate synthase